MSWTSNSLMFNMLNDFLKVPWTCNQRCRASPCWWGVPYPAPLTFSYAHPLPTPDPLRHSPCRAAKRLAPSPYLAAVFQWKLGLDYSWITPGKTPLREDWCKTTYIWLYMCTYAPVALFAWMAGCKFCQAAASSVLKSVNRTSVKRFRFQQQHQNWPS